MFYNENIHSKLIMTVPYHTINLQNMHIPNKMFLPLPYQWPLCIPLENIRKQKMPIGPNEKNTFLPWITICVRDPLQNSLLILTR